MGEIVPAPPELQILRAHVEREVRRSSVIMVTSAQDGDGKSLTAFSLARCLAESGLRTALVDATSNGRLIVGTNRSVTSEKAELVELTMPATAGPLREAIAAFIESSRSSFDYTIVDSSTLTGDSIALALAANVDGILISVRVGRAATKNDDSIVRIIEGFGGRILGIVAAQSAAIAAFAAPRQPEMLMARPERREDRASALTVRSGVRAVLAFGLIVATLLVISKGSS
jgi:Mrp family chromosome partitioning ATPase